MYEHTEHQWCLWYPIRDDTVSPDPEDGKYYRYFRDCQIRGCTFCEKAENVEATGPTRVYDPEPVKPWHKG